MDEWHSLAAKMAASLHMTCGEPVPCKGFYATLASVALEFTFCCADLCKTGAYLLCCRSQAVLLVAMSGFML